MDHLGGAGFVFKVVEWLARLCASLRRRSQEKLEDKILKYIAQNREWSSPKGLWAEEYFRTVKGFPFPPAPPEALRGWAKYKWHSGLFLFQVRHHWRKFFHLVPKRQLANVMWCLWKRGLLERDARGGELYRLKR